MCIIIYKPGGVDMPSRKALENCWNKNPDGGGFMYADGKRVYYQKGFMTFRSFYKALKRADIGDAPTVIHFRIATHGGTSKSMTHPFEVTTSTKRLKATAGTCSIACAHNGILSMTADKATASMSDTAVFVRDVLTRLCRKPTYYRDNKIADIISACAGVSRLAIMSADGHVETVGKWYTENGVMYSNDGYKQKALPTTRTKPLPATWKWYNPCDQCEKPFCYDCKHWETMSEREYNYYKDSYLDF